jgi:hypothetical protein
LGATCVADITAASNSTGRSFKNLLRKEWNEEK